MRQSQKHDGAQVSRRGRAAGAGEDALAQGSAAFARAGFPDPGMVLRWSEIAGAEVARVARPVKFQDGADGGVLTLRCSPGAAVLLQHETRALIARLNGYLGHRRIQRLRLVTGAVPVSPAPAKHPSPDCDQTESLPPADLPAALERLAKRRRRARRGGN